ncbi:acyl-CoA dehydrogenase family protein [Methylobacterium sp. A49B]|uniref:Acyl-CoA dehydrogenase n=1 Tax=Methylobacterium mesophilicum SR1.6/6 TaxID=908290 RepID=A0A6B9FV45_9HYPH|nr:acyl-CoA dehydrogenase family protein [Methylobacterium mesophilicum]QGY05719.1 acyl-CoA dehydrogenase [Methylobacterium mesophilicum SR1.6/6]
MSTLTARAERAAAVAARHADAVDRDGRFPEEAVAAMKAERLLGLQIPSQFGGEGAGLTQIAELCSTLGHACSAAAMVFAMHHIKVSSLVTHGLDSAWHCRLMERIAREQLLVASSTTEAGIGGDLRNSLCAVEATGDVFSLGKDASVISYGSHADLILATARRNPDAPTSDQVLVALLADQISLVRTGDWDTLGMRGTCSEGFRLEARDVPLEQILPKPFAEIAAQSMLASSHLLWSSVWYGITTYAVDRARAFVQAEARRRPGQVPPTATRLAEVSNAHQAMRGTIVSALRRFEDAHGDADTIGSIGFSVMLNNLKVTVSDMAVDIVRRALAIVGLAGYRNDTPFSLGRPLRDVLSAPLMIGNDRILANTAKLLLVQKGSGQLMSV